jgi:hypothetical protein
VMPFYVCIALELTAAILVLVRGRSPKTVAI